MRKPLPFIVILAVTAALAWWLWPRPPAAGPGMGAGAVAMPVETAMAEERDVTPTLSAVGTLVANEDVVLRPEISGRVVALRFTEGQHVARGTTLVELDASVYKAQVDSADASLHLARRNFDRANDLLEKKLGSVRDRDIAEEQLRAAEAALELARANLDKTVLRSPFPAVVGLRAVSPGDYVAAGQDLVRLVDLDVMKVDFELPESALPLISDHDPITVMPDALPGESFAGNVYAVEPAVTETGRTLTLRARLDNPQGRLKPGMFARVQLRSSTPVHGVVVPDSAILPGMDKAAVFRIIEDRAERVSVALGERAPGWVQVTEGLVAGDEVVTAGQDRLRDGAMVARTPAAGH